MHKQMEEINIPRRKAESLLNTLYKKYGPINTVYHYTNCEAAVKILESKNILMTHFQKTNDTQELLYGEKLIRKIVENIPFILSKEIWHSMIEKSSYLDIYIPYFASFCQDELAVKKEFNTTHISSITFGSHINQKDIDNLSNFLSIHYPNVSINYSKLTLRRT